MGQKHSTNAFIELEQDELVSGQRVTGTVHVDQDGAELKLGGGGLQLLVEGREVVEWMETVTQGGEVRKEPREEARDVLRSWAPLYRPPKQKLPKGHFSFPFAFALPPGLPGSFDAEISGTGVRAAVTYRVAVVARDTVLAQVPLTVREAAQPVQRASAGGSVPVTEWCGCAGRGELTVRAAMPQNLFAPSDVATVALHVANESTVATRHAQVRLIRTVTVVKGQRTIRRTGEMSTVDARGVGANATVDYDVQITIDSPNGEAIYASTLGEKVRCEYAIEVRLPCGDRAAEVVLPIHLAPTYRVAAPPAPVRPDNWAPVVAAQVELPMGVAVPPAGAGASAAAAAQAVAPAAVQPVVGEALPMAEALPVAQPL